MAASKRARQLLSSDIYFAVCCFPFFFLPRFFPRTAGCSTVRCLSVLSLRCHVIIGPLMGITEILPAFVRQPPWYVVAFVVVVIIVAAVVVVQRPSIHLSVRRPLYRRYNCCRNIITDMSSQRLCVPWVPYHGIAWYDMLLCQLRYHNFDWPDINVHPPEWIHSWVNYESDLEVDDTRECTDFRQGAGEVDH